MAGTMRPFLVPTRSPQATRISPAEIDVDDIKQAFETFMTTRDSRDICRVIKPILANVIVTFAYTEGYIVSRYS